MLKLWVISSLVCSVFVMVTSSGDIGPGVWHVIHIQKREEESHSFKFNVSQRKIDRTHDGFNADFKLDEDLSDQYAIHVDICKHVDGGCKQYQVLSDESFINFVNKYAKNNVKGWMEEAGIDPPDFPIKKGEYHIKDYIFDYEELPEKSIYGIFEAVACLLDKTIEVGCIEMHMEFSKSECEDGDDCEEE